ncbi:MAG: class I adenylate-forming enzyme family protein [Candidatus Aminicenantes bacterium]|jgi:malonyl-CoA/methylmalonyl-CoA synthetase
MKSFIELLKHQFQENSRCPAVIYHNHRFTFGELAERAIAIGSFLREKGLKTGDIVILYTREKLSFLLIHLGIILCGGVSLPLNPDFTAEEMTYFLNDSGARFVFASGQQVSIIEKIKNKCPGLKSVFDPSIALNEKLLRWGSGSPGLLEKNHKLQNTNYKQITNHNVQNYKQKINQKLLRGVKGGGFLEKSPPCFMLYSSGTTGQPKGVMHTHANTGASLLALQKCWKFSPGDVLLNVLPLFHIHGLSFAAHLSLISGSSMIIEDRFHPLKTMERIKDATVFMGVPTYYYSFLNRREFRERAKEWQRTRLFTCGSAPIRSEVLDEIENIIGRPLINRYGMTESHVITSLPLVGPYKRGSVGLLLEGIEVKIGKPGTEDAGEVMVRGQNLFDHYWKKPGATQSAFDKDGFFKTGDLGYFDDDGYLFLKGRKSDLVISSGFNVYPAVVERVINEFPGVKESAVIGIPDPVKGEKVMAVVVPEVGGKVAIGELKKHCREKLVNYQCPVAFEIVAELPRNTMGKVLKRELKEKFKDR